MKAPICVGFLLLAFVTGCQNQQRPEMAASKPASDPIKNEPASSSEPAAKAQSKRLYSLDTLATVSLQAPKARIEAWVMDDSAKRQEGMMWLTEADMPAGKGMIFVFPDEADRSFWMANTLIPLDIAYIDAKGKVLNVLRGEPESDASLTSDGPSKYVIEVRAGEAERLGLRKGSRIRIPSGLTSAD